MNFSDVTVLCVGDIMLDRFMSGEVERISPEAPVPVIRLLRAREMLGGAANVAHNVASLGGLAILIGLIGRDDAGSALTSLITRVGRIEPALVTTGDRPTICKTRFIAAQQQIVRADDESLLPLQPAEEEALIAMVDAHISAASVVILSDYGKAVLSRRVLRHSIEAARARGVALFVDPKSRDFSVYRGATCITPNLRELALASGRPVGDAKAVASAAREALATAAATAILATRSEMGMMLIETSGAVHSVETRAREVFDVSGAGDTVIATMALAHGSGLSLAQSMRIANAAAGVVVGKLGTAVVTVTEVIEELDEQDRAAGFGPPGLCAFERGLSLAAHWKSQGLKVGFTNGCFDILHPGHVALLRAARAECDRLIVALNTDDSVSRLKGPMRPVNDLICRAQVIAALRYVDCVVSFDENTPLKLIEHIVPDVLIKGADYKVESVVGAEVVQKAGGRVFLVDLVSGLSTSNIVAKLQFQSLQPTMTEQLV